MSTATTARGPAVTADDQVIRPFTVNVPQQTIDELRRRLAATNWPEKETVPDDSQGVRLATIQKLARYWATDYDWRTCEVELNALPQFITEIDEIDSTSSTFVPATTTRCRSSSTTGGRGRS